MAAPASVPAVFNIPAGAPFADRLVAGLLDRLGIAGQPTDPTALVRATLLVPTRRSVRAVTDAFARRFAGSVVLLPRILTLGELDADDVGDSDEDAPDAAVAGTEIPPAITPLRRQMLLTDLVSQLGASAWREKPTADQAARLASELALLLDQVETEELTFAGLEALVPSVYAEHWQKTLEFLRILTLHWPAILAAEGVIDPASRRIRLLRARAEAWSKNPPPGPVIAAGSTGSIPAVADLLGVIARLPQGAVVLPGLDPALSNEGWAALGPSHPQFGLKHLIDKIAIKRSDVREWPSPDASVSTADRARLIGAALAPAAVAEDEGTEEFDAAHVRAAAQGLTRIDCPGPDDEAGVIALLMRETLTTPGKTCALVTPDRDLARRTASALTRWDIDVDDSAGIPLALSPAGLYFRLVAAAASERFAPLPLLSLLKHPFAAGGSAVGAFRARVRRIELLVLRGPRPGQGFEGLATALKELPPDQVPDARELVRWVEMLAEMAAPLVAALGRGTRPVIEIVNAHTAFAEALAATDTENGAERLWRGDDGEALANYVAELKEAVRGFSPVSGRHYPALLTALLSGRVVRPRAGRHPRLFIWGPLEARLQGADRLILGGLNEGNWPREPEADPWMSRPMREDFQLPAPERRIGLAAHDFVQGASAPEVFLTRAVRVEGTPTVPARWLLRLDHFLTRAKAPGALGAAKPWLRWLSELDKPQATPRPKRPAPCPPLAARPRRLSVTEIETWMRDPYALYARRILGLSALDPIDAQKDAADRGMFIHRALETFLKAYPEILPNEETAYQRLLECGRQAFGAALEQPAVRVFWWPRFERIARWFVQEEAKRRETVRPLVTEARGQITLETNGKPFVLVGRADRIDRRLDDGSLVFSDYKTGAPPSTVEVAEGFAPQLPLEAVIAARGGFEGVPALPTTELLYWRLSGGDPPAEIKSAVKKGEPAAPLIEDTLAGLLALIAAFDDPATSYLPSPRADRAPRFSDYEHLARVQEWASGDGNDEAGE